MQAVARQHNPKEHIFYIPLQKNHFTCVPLPLPGGPNKTALMPLFGTSFGGAEFSFAAASVRGAIFIQQCLSNVL